MSGVPRAQQIEANPLRRKGEPTAETLPAVGRGVGIP
jgi:hypothetical protein